MRKFFGVSDAHVEQFDVQILVHRVQSAMDARETDSGQFELGPGRNRAKSVAT